MTDVTVRGDTVTNIIVSWKSRDQIKNKFVP